MKLYLFYLLLELLYWNRLIWFEYHKKWKSAISTAILVNELSMLNDNADLWRKINYSHVIKYYTKHFQFLNKISIEMKYFVLFNLFSVYHR